MCKPVPRGSAISAVDIFSPLSDKIPMPTPLKKIRMLSPAKMLELLSVEPGALAVIETVLSGLNHACAQRTFFVRIALEREAMRTGTQRNKELQEACVRLGQVYSVKVLGDLDAGGCLVVGLPGYHDFG